LRCTSNAYLFNNTCTLCSSQLSQCFSCSNAMVCDQCFPGYSALASKGLTCAQIVTTCSVNNCAKCAPVSYCILCNRGFSLSSGQCTATAACSGGQIFDGTACICPPFTYLSSNRCLSCPDNCILCNSYSCLICTPTYYISSGNCLNCPNNCLTCSSNSLCLTCTQGYTLVSGACSFIGLANRGAVQSSSGLIACPPNCRSCILDANSAIICLRAAVGGVIGLDGRVTACSSNCRECDPANSNICTRCYSGLALLNGQCTPCLDSNCIDCSTVGTCKTCKIGYAINDGVCSGCSSNCLSCVSAGAGSCDSGGC
jgi:hypothetical protein